MVKQVAEYLQMDEYTIYKLPHSGCIPGIKIAGQWRFKKEIIDNDKWINDSSLKNLSKEGKL